MYIVLDVQNIFDLTDGPEKTLLLVAWFQGLFEGKAPPILVGGAAVELYTGGAYQTGDLDFVGSVPRGVAEMLEQAGFRRQGRHWLHEEAQVFIELPGSSLGVGERSETLRRGSTEVLLVSPEDLIADRLAAWQFWESEEDAVNAFLIWRSNDIDRERALERARAADVSESFRSLTDFLEQFADATPTPEQLSAWASKRA